MGRSPPSEAEKPERGEHKGGEGRWRLAICGWGPQQESPLGDAGLVLDARLLGPEHWAKWYPCPCPVDPLLGSHPGQGLIDPPPPWSWCHVRTLSCCLFSCL